MEAQKQKQNNLSVISDVTSDPRGKDWLSEDSFKLASDFSDSMSDHVSEKRQSEEIGKATGNITDDSNSQTHTTQWLKDLPRSFTPAADIKSEVMNEWPNANKTQSETGTGCSKTQDATGLKDAASMLSVDTTEAMGQMSFVGGMEYTRQRFQAATASRPSGKGLQVRPPVVTAALTQTATTGPHGESRSTSLESKASRATSGRSSAYRIVHEAALARKTLLEAQTDAIRAMARLAERSRNQVVNTILSQPR